MEHIKLSNGARQMLTLEDQMILLRSLTRKTVNIIMPMIMHDHDDYITMHTREEGKAVDAWYAGEEFADWCEALEREEREQAEEDQRLGQWHHDYYHG